MALAETRNNRDCVAVTEWAKDRLSMKELVPSVWKEIEVHNLTGLAAQTSYYFVLAFFPFLIFLSALVGSLPFTGLWDEVLTWITLFLESPSK